MSHKNPIIAITGSSGAGTTTTTTAFQHIFRTLDIDAAFVEGDCFHRFSRPEMEVAIRKAKEQGRHISYFGAEANDFGALENFFASYGETGSGKIRHYLHTFDEAVPYNQLPGTFTPWQDLRANTDLLFYEGLHGAVVSENLNIARYADLKIGVVPVINLEWIQKIHRDRDSRGYSTEAVTDTILRRMHAYVHCICPQFTETDINFQRVPVVDTSNPLVARWIPTADESLVVIRFKDPHGIDFPYLVSMIHDSWMSRANSIVIPGGKLDLAMQLILTPLVGRLVNQSKRAL